jgi:hypothetical protein
MKNIHLISTDKPSRLHLGNSGLVLCDFKFGKNTINGQNIYITNDEEIKEGDYMFDVSEMTVYECIGQGVSGYKIILTTDQDLDGVQSIDDTFLEWFVRNPSCESVEVIKDLFQVNQNNPVLKGSTALVKQHRIIIPQEEPKQETLEEREPYWYLIDKKAEQNNQIDLDAYANGVQDGVKWQKEQDKNKYSEEDVYDLLVEWTAYQNGFPRVDEDEIPNGFMSFNQWFEQFKKK